MKKFIFLFLFLVPIFTVGQTYTSQQGNKYFKGFIKFAKRIIAEDTVRVSAKGIKYADGSIGTTGFQSGDTISLDSALHFNTATDTLATKAQLRALNPTNSVARDSLYIGTDGYVHYVKDGYDVRLAVKDSTALDSPLLTDLLAYWNFNETSGNVLDQVGDLDGVVSGATQNVTGKVGKGVNFDGTDDVVQVAYNSSMNISPPFSFSAWIYQNASDADPIFSRDFGSGVVPYIFEISYGFPRLRYYDTDYRNFNDDEQLPNIQTWYHFVVTANSTETKLYLNGSLITTLSGIASLPTNSTSLYFGHHPDASSYFNGIIDEVGIWTRVLTATEVSNLYNSGSGVTYPF